LTIGRWLVLLSTILARRAPVLKKPLDLLFQAGYGAANLDGVLMPILPTGVSIPRPLSRFKSIFPALSRRIFFERLLPVDGFSRPAIDSLDVNGLDRRGIATTHDGFP
jgi:hypothetical protein